MPAASNGHPDVVALVGSAGGIAPIETVLQGLPAYFPAAILVLIHLMPQHPSVLAAIFGRHTVLDVKQAEDGDVLEAARVFVAPPDAHLVVTPGGILRLEDSALVHYVRPSADALLLSLAANYDGRCLAVVLSGTGIDGAAGAAAVRRAGGVVVAQDEATSAYFGMPGAAILVGVDHVLPVEEIGSALLEFAGVPA